MCCGCDCDDAKRQTTKTNVQAELSNKIKGRKKVKCFDSGSFVYFSFASKNGSISNGKLLHICEKGKESLVASNERRVYRQSR